MSKILALVILVTSALSHSVSGKDVEIMLADNLDGYLDGYCLDIVGNGNHITPDKGLQVHTCYRYQGSIGDDQAFDDTKFAEHQLYLSKLDVCVQATELDSRSPVELAECSDSELQRFEFNPDGTIRSAFDTQLCLTAGLETKRGRGGTSDHQIKALTLHKCSEAKEIFQVWTTR
ncbi:RICIN domain-containing protein [Vibrio agarivorans]|uniref:RICIN domain-containing protein n=1 Tax=Vibrio agarivorans TaxID=153622 RepID=UPI0025B459CD|nr:RICIN domain-containing protein [Vibrio agarivorans]MDN3659803.1 RICIN domain-containing protein [Vibrio agarivorans]